MRRKDVIHFKMNFLFLLRFRCFPRSFFPSEVQKGNIREIRKTFKERAQIEIGIFHIIHALLHTVTADRHIPQRHKRPRDGFRSVAHGAVPFLLFLLGFLYRLLDFFFCIVYYI